MADLHLKQLIDRIYPLSEEASAVLETVFTTRMVEKNDFILKEGQLTEKLFFIKSGIFRGFYIKEIDEITFNFFSGLRFMLIHLQL